MENPSYSQPPVQNSTLAIVSLIAGIAGWSVVPFFGSLVAVITGHMAKKEIRESGMGGDGLATVGLVLGYSSLGLSLLGICIAIFAIAFGVGLPFCLIPFAGTSQFISLLLGF